LRARQSFHLLLLLVAHLSTPVSTLKQVSTEATLACRRQLVLLLLLLLLLLIVMVLLEDAHRSAPDDKGEKLPTVEVQERENNFTFPFGGHIWRPGK